MATQLNKTKTAANAITFTAVVVVALVCLNVVGTRLFGRVDLTSERVYTLSPASRDVVAHLPDRLTVKAFISGDLTPPFSQTAQYVRDMLAEYASASKGKLHWTVVDPGSDPDLAKEADKLKVPKRRRGSVSSSDKLEISASYLGIAFEYQGNVESIPEVNSPEGLEFEMTSIIRLLTVKKKKVAFATSEGELSLSDDQRGAPGMQMVKQNLRGYEVVPVALNTGDAPIADDVDVLVIAGPKQPFSDRAKYVIDQFLMRGKSVAFFVDGMVLEQPRGMQLPGQDKPSIGRKNDVGLDDLLGSYGIHIKDDIVMEPRQNMVGPLPVQGQLFLANYPTFVTATDLDKKSSVTDRIPGIVLPFTSSLELDAAAQKNQGATYTVLARSTADAWKQGGFFLFDPAANSLKIGSEKGPFALGYAVSGKLKSFYAGKPYPNAKGENDPPPAANTSLPPGLDHPLDEAQGPARIIVFGSSGLLSDEYLRFARQVSAYANDVLLFLNAVDWLAGDDAMAAIRAKGVTSRPLTYSSAATPPLVKYVNVVGIPLLFVLFGVLRWRVRTARRRNARL